MISLDILPTLLAAAGGEIPSDLALDGRDALTVWRGDGQAPERALFWDYRGYSAVRKGRHKLIRGAPDQPFQLFDLENDMSERADLAQKRPEVAAQLRRELKRWIHQFDR